MADKKISELTGVTTLPETSLLTAVDLLRAANDQNVKIPLSDFIALVASDPTLNNPVENTYLDVASMIADQANQTINFFEYVSGTDEYYEYLDLGNVNINDYRLLTSSEVLTVIGNLGYKTFRLQSIQDDTTPLTTISNGRIGFEYDTGTDAVTGVFFNSAYTNIIQRYVDTFGTILYYINIYNRNERRYDIAEVSGFATVNTDFTLASIQNTIDRNNFTVNDRLEVNFDIDVAGGGGGSGTVTSVAISGSDGIEVDSGSPVTTSGTIVLGLNQATTKTFLNYLEQEIDGTTAESVTVTGATNISLDGVVDRWIVLTGNATITFTDTPAINTGFVRSYSIKSTVAETLGIANSTDEFGTYAADGTVNEMTVKASNYATEGLIIRVFFSQPN